MKHKMPNATSALLLLLTLISCGGEKNKVRIQRLALLKKTFFPRVNSVLQQPSQAMHTTVCIAEVGIFEIRPTGCDADLNCVDEIIEMKHQDKSGPELNLQY